MKKKETVKQNRNAERERKFSRITRERRKRIRGGGRGGVAKAKK